MAGSTLLWVGSYGNPHSSQLLPLPRGPCYPAGDMLFTWTVPSARCLTDKAGWGVSGEFPEAQACLCLSRPIVPCPRASVPDLSSWLTVSPPPCSGQHQAVLHWHALARLTALQWVTSGPAHEPSTVPVWMQLLLMADTLGSLDRHHSRAGTP